MNWFKGSESKMAAIQQAWHEGRHLNTGANAQYDENDKEELVFIRENLIAQNEGIGGIINELGDVKLLMKVLFTTLDKDAIDAIKSTYADRMGGVLEDMVNYVEGFICAKAVASNITADLSQNNNGEMQGNQRKDVKNPPPFYSTITKAAPIRRFRRDRKVRPRGGGFV